MGNFWWSTELVRSQSWLAAFLERRLASRATAEEVAASVIEEVVKRLEDKKSLPAEWFGVDTPSVELENAFRGLIFRIAERRVLDEFRRRYRELAASSGFRPRMQTGGDAEAQLDARRALLALAKLLDELEPEDRELLLQERADDDLAGLAPSARERELTRRRVRRHRLRQWLAERLVEEGKQ